MFRNAQAMAIFSHSSSFYALCIKSSVLSGQTYQLDMRLTVVNAEVGPALPIPSIPMTNLSKVFKIKDERLIRI